MHLGVTLLLVGEVIIRIYVCFIYFLNCFGGFTPCLSHALVTSLVCICPCFSWGQNMAVDDLRSCASVKVAVRR